MSEQTKDATKPWICATARGGETDHATDDGETTLCGRAVYSTLEGTRFIPGFQPTHSYACSNCARVLRAREDR